MILILQFLVSLASVFFKGLQHQNVIGGKYKEAFFISYIMAVLDVAVISFVVQSGWGSVIPIGTGAAIGIVTSMALYRKINKEDIK